MPEQQQENPIYVLPQLKKRIFIPSVFSLIILAIIFYLGILLNISLLELSNDEKSIIKIISLIVLFILFTLGIILSFIRAQKKYLFYNDRINFGKKAVLYTEITNTTAAQNFVDKIFKTYSIKLNEKSNIKNISLQIDIQSYLQQLIDYARRIS